MAIWGKRDNESAAEEPSAEVTPAAATPENDLPTRATPENDPPADAAPGSDPPPDAAHEGEPSAGEPAPVFWRPQGRPLAPGYGQAPGSGQPTVPTDEPESGHGRAQEGGPEPAYDRVPAEPAAQAGEPEAGSGRAAAEAPAPPVSEAPAGTDASAPVLAEDVVVLDAEAAAKDPAVTEPARDPAEAAGEPAVAQEPPAFAVPAPAGAAAAAAVPSPGSPDSPGSISPQRWSEILVAFVDDPRGSVKMAADAVDQAIDEVVTSVRARQRALESSWQGSDADTEQLRTVLREYRRFGAQVRQMSPEEPARPGAAAAG